MFIHFDSDPDASCDNCERNGTIMHISVERFDHTLNLCHLLLGNVPGLQCRFGEAAFWGKWIEGAAVLLKRE